MDKGFFIAFEYFSSRSSLNNFAELIIPNSVINIGSGAFNGCGITRLSLGTGVQTIGDFAFGSNNITELTIPANVRTMGVRVFSANQIKSLTIQNGITRIGQGAFEYNPIETLVLPASLAANGIGQGAFSRSWTEPTTATRITVPANMVDTYLISAGFDQGFINFYRNQNRAAGTYVKNGPIWTRQ